MKRTSIVVLLVGILESFNVLILLNPRVSISQVTEYFANAQICVGTFLSTRYTFSTLLIYPSELPNENYFSYFWKEHFFYWYIPRRGPFVCLLRVAFEVEDGYGVLIE